jgi:cutinase
MSARNVGRILGVAVATAWVLTAVADTRHASAGPCADVEVVSARGTEEPTGPGSIGQTFIDSLRPEIPGRSLEIYAVRYPASGDYNRSEAAGADDARAHAESTVANCPDTRIVLSGYSQGAAVIDLVTEQLPPELADHIAAVALFGNPKSALARSYGGGYLPVLSPLYRPKTIDLCAPGDPICSEGTNEAAHHLYDQNGMTTQAAAFVAQKLQ